MREREKGGERGGARERERPREGRTRYIVRGGPRGLTRFPPGSNPVLERPPRPPSTFAVFLIVSDENERESARERGERERERETDR